MRRINSQLCRTPSKFKHLGSEGDWLNFFWGLWTMGGSNQFDISEINEIWADTQGEEWQTRVYCVPKTTLASPYGQTPEDGYETGWTCKDKYWVWKSRTTHTETRYFGIGRTTVVVPDQFVHAKKHNRGKDYWAVRETVRTNLGTLKYDHFHDIAQKSKIIY